MHTFISKFQDIVSYMSYFLVNQVFHLKQQLSSISFQQRSKTDHASYRGSTSSSMNRVKFIKSFKAVREII